ncbi:MAG: hypothetical protein KME64_11295 [Scytonematopsis contorta HA4267-MV1]|jgi:hypothetical protein|nr:hypothetical protein [Scytonematopsis contorta HA4267-MV1]
MLQTNVKLKKLLSGVLAIVSVMFTNAMLTGCGASETEKPDTKAPQENIYKNQSNDSDEDKEEKKDKEDKEDKQQVRKDDDDDDERGGDKQKYRKKDAKQDND